MEYHFDTVLYLVVGVIYLFLNNIKGRHTEKQTGASEDDEPRSAPTAHTTRPAARNREIQETLTVREPLPKNAIEKKTPFPGHDTSAHLAVQKPHEKGINHRFRRYGSWKKAIVMGELLLPRP